jgi:transcriptional regulator with XRE-family HTH domain
MELKKYINEREISITTAAKGIGISRQYLTDILKGTRIPGRATAFKIMEWSGDMVKLTDLWK